MKTILGSFRLGQQPSGDADVYPQVDARLGLLCYSASRRDQLRGSSTHEEHRRQRPPSTFNKYRYTGAFIDVTSTGLYKMGARYYNQDTGRFTQPDPSGQEPNRYIYTNSNPVTYVDPTGLGDINALQGAGMFLSFVGSLVPGPIGAGIGVAGTALGVAGDIAAGEDAGSIALDAGLGLASAAATRFGGGLAAAAGEELAWTAEYGAGALDLGVSVYSDCIAEEC